MMARKLYMLRFEERETQMGSIRRRSWGPYWVIARDPSEAQNRVHRMLRKRVTFSVRLSMLEEIASEAGMYAGKTSPNSLFLPPEPWPTPSAATGSTAPAAAAAGAGGGFVLGDPEGGVEQVDISANEGVDGEE